MADPTPVDLFLSPDLTEAQAHAYLESLGFRDAARADGHLQQMADDPVVRETLGRLAPDLIQALLETPDADAAAAGVSQYVAARSGRAMFLDYLREDPRALHVLAYVMGASPILGEILIRTPEYFHWLVAQVERSAPDRQDHEEELVSAFRTIDDPEEALNIVRRWKRRETLRIGTRELLRSEPVQAVANQLSDVACVAVDFALAIIMRQLLTAEGRDKPPGTFAVIATGQLGGCEMTYQSDLALLYVYDTPAAGADESRAREFFVNAGCELTAALEEETHEGFLYRVRPATAPGDRSLTARSLDEYRERYAGSLEPPERYALVRARPIAGDADLGRRFVACGEQSVYGDAAGSPSAAMPAAAVGDPGGWEDEIARFTHEIQLRHGAAHAPLRHAGTVASLYEMRRAGLIDGAACSELERAYVFLRSAEHRRELGLKEQLDEQLAASRQRVREICRSLA